MSEEPTERSPEAPEADAAEQRAQLRDDDESTSERPARRRDDVDEADAADQEHEVQLDEEEYR